MANNDFQRAKVDVGFRYSYVHNFDLEDMKRYVKDAFYSSQNYTNGMMNNEANSFNIKEFMEEKVMTPGYLSTTHVFPETFDGRFSFLESIIRNEEDFASCLIDHEGRHGQQHYEFPNSMVLPASPLSIRNPEVFGELQKESDSLKSFSQSISQYKLNKIINSWDSADLELEAYEFQLNRINEGKRNVSNVFFKSLNERVDFHRALVNYRAGNIEAKELYKKVV